MAGPITDQEAADLMPAVYELVDLVAERDQAGVAAALAHTPPETLAVLTAGLVAELTKVPVGNPKTRGEYEDRHFAQVMRIRFLEQNQKDQAAMIARLRAERDQRGTAAGKE